MEPKIRLKGFSAEWEETSLGKLSTNYKYGINAAAIPYDGKNKYLRKIMMEKINISELLILMKAQECFLKII